MLRDIHLISIFNLAGRCTLKSYLIMILIQWPDEKKGGFGKQSTDGNDVNLIMFILPFQRHFTSFRAGTRVASSSDIC